MNEMTHKHHKKAKKHHKKHHQKSIQSLVETSAKTVKAPVAKPAPAAKNLISTKITNQDEFDKFAMNVDVPIDEVKAITLKVAPTYNLD